MISSVLRAAGLAALVIALPAAAGASEVVPLDHFSGVGLRGGGHVLLKHGATQSVTLVKGSTQYTSLKVRGDSLEIDACNETCPQQYDLEIEIVSPQVDAVAISGGGAIVAAGGFPSQAKLDAAVSGGGAIDLRALQAATVDAAVNGGGHIQFRANGTLNAAVSGCGHIAYAGHPKLSEAVTGGGAIDRAD